VLRYCLLIGSHSRLELAGIVLVAFFVVVKLALATVFATAALAMHESEFLAVLAVGLLELSVFAVTLATLGAATALAANGARRLCFFAFRAYD
jgi:hypothetical protein